jgi:hypothetical protein
VSKAIPPDLARRQQSQVYCEPRNCQAGQATRWGRKRRCAATLHHVRHTMGRSNPS